jgi:hypothetical protein
VGLHLSINPLIGASYQGVAFLDIGIYTPVSACPIGMFTEKTDATWYK